MFSFGFLIFVMATGRGWLSIFLARPCCVLLGEISFSIYLLHQILLRYYRGNLVFFPEMPGGPALALWDAGSDPATLAVGVLVPGQSACAG